MERNKRDRKLTNKIRRKKTTETYVNIMMMVHGTMEANQIKTLNGET